MTTKSTIIQNFDVHSNKHRGYNMFVSIFLFFGFFLFGCQPDPITLPEMTVGMAPIYSNIEDITVRTNPPMEFINLDKIVTQGDFIFILDLGLGVHVIDNSDPNNPITVYFWQITNCTDFTISEQTLFARVGDSLLSVDISDFSSIVLTTVLEDVIESQSLLAPPDYFGFFECVDPSRGFVIGWVEMELERPACWI